MKMTDDDIKAWHTATAISFEKALAEHGLERPEDAHDVEVEIVLTKMQVEKETLEQVLGIEKA